MVGLPSWLSKSLGLAVLAALGLWVAGVAWFHLPQQLALPGALVWAAVCGAGLWQALKGTVAGKRWALGCFLAGLILAGVQWWRLEPFQERDWADDVAQRLQVSRIDGPQVTLDNVRNFHWRSETDYQVSWEQRHYDLRQLQSADLFLSYWMGPAIAHTLVSFGFSDGRYLVFSLEIRKERDESFDALAGFFRRYEMTLVASEETDIIRVRSNIRGEQVDLYRVAALQGKALENLFLAYLDQARALDAAPAFYNTLTSNCTTIVWDMARRVSPGLPLDWRLLASGYFAGYVHELGALVPGHSLAQLQRAGRITPRALQARDTDDFSQAIRQGVPGMQTGVSP